jgi:hypothetical protein
VLRSRLQTISDTSYLSRLSRTVSSDPTHDNTVRLYGFYRIFWRISRPNPTSFRGLPHLSAGHLLVVLRQNTGYLSSSSTNRFALLHHNIHRSRYHQSFKFQRSTPLKLHRPPPIIRLYDSDPPPAAVSCSGGVGKAVLVFVFSFSYIPGCSHFLSSSFVIVFLLQSGKVHSFHILVSLYCFISFINQYTFVFLLQSVCSHISLSTLHTRSDPQLEFNDFFTH